MNLNNFERLVSLPCYSDEFKDTLSNQKPSVIKAYQESSSQELTSLISEKKVFAHENHIFQLAA